MRAATVEMSAPLTGNPASLSAPAIQALVRELVLVSKASRYPDSRITRTARTAPGSGRHETARTPSMSIKTARIFVIGRR